MHTFIWSIVQITHFLLTTFHRSQNKHFSICQTVHGEAQIQLHALEFALFMIGQVHTNNVFNHIIEKSFIYTSPPIYRSDVCSFCQMGIILCTKHETENWQKRTML